MVKFFQRGRGEFRMVDPTRIDYDEETGDEGHPSGDVSVIGGYESPNFHRYPHRDDEGVETEQIADRHSWMDARGKVTDESTELFTHVPPQIDEAYVHHVLRSQGSTLLGLGLQAARQTGVPIPSSSLSAHSSKVVKRALATGAINPNPMNPESRDSNYIASEGLANYKYLIAEDDYRYMRQEARNGGRNYTWHEVPEEQLASARRMVRTALRPKGTQFPAPTDTGPAHAGISQSQHEWKRDAPAPPGKGQQRLL